MEKTIKQGSNKVKVSGNVTPDGYMKYKDEGVIKIDNETKTVFTFLEMSIMMDRKYLDTKWFPYEHEGRLGEGPTIWADSRINGQVGIQFYVTTIDLILRL